MTRGQRTILILMLVALGGTLLLAPWNYRVRNTVGELETGRVIVAQRSAYRPAWNPPPVGFGGYVKYPSDSNLTVEEVRLDMGKLALWWAGIVIVGGILTLLAKPKRS